MSVAAVDWGDVPTWLASFAAVAALIAAIVAAKQARRLYQIEVDRDRLAADDRRRAADDARRLQASRFVAWQDQRSGTLETGEFVVLDLLVAENRSDLPLFAVDVSATAADGRELNGFKVGTMPPGARQEVPLEQGGGPRTLSADAVRDAYQEALRGIEIEAKFTDTSGVRWMRSPSGSLEEIRATGGDGGVPAG
jgi:hypothetical protein